MMLMRRQWDGEKYLLLDNGRLEYHTITGWLWLDGVGCCWVAKIWREGSSRASRLVFVEIWREGGERFARSGFPAKRAHGHLLT